jgi:hypothetical protein
MARFSIGIRSAMVITALAALAIAAVLQGRRILALESQVRRLGAQNVQSANMVMEMNMKLNEIFYKNEVRIHKLEHPAAGDEVAPVKP